MENTPVKNGIMVAIGVIAVILLVVMVIAAWHWQLDMTVAPSLTLQKLEENVEQSYIALHKDICYDLEDTNGITALCDFSEWQQYELSLQENKPEIAGGHILTLRMGDEYELAFYEGGVALAYYGYADAAKYHNSAWYIVPENTVKNLVEFIHANGTVREVYLGAASWFSIDG